MISDISPIDVALNNGIMVPLRTGITLQETQDHLTTYPQYFRNPKVVVLCLGHADIPLYTKGFFNRYERICALIRAVNNEAWIILTSLLPVHDVRDFPILAHKKSKNADIKAYALALHKCAYFDAIDKMKVKNFFPQDYVQNSRLTLVGARKFFKSLGHKISALCEAEKAINQ